MMLVTTKSGKENTKATVNVSVEASYFRPMNTPEFVDGPTYMRLYNEAQLARNPNIATLRYTEDEIAATAAGTNPYVYPNVDWYDLMFRSGNYNQRANVNVSGGASRVTYYMSLQANHDTGLFDAPQNDAFNPNINNWEYNFQNNISYKLTNTTTVDLRMMAQIGNQQGPNYDNIETLYQQVMYANPVSFPATFPAQEGDSHIRYGNAEIKAGTYGVNPFQQMMGSFREDNYNTLNTSLNITQDFGFITEGLSAKVLVNFKNWSNSYYSRSLTPYYYQVQPGTYDPETDTYDLQLLQAQAQADSDIAGYNAEYGQLAIQAAQAAAEAQNAYNMQIAQMQMAQNQFEAEMAYNQAQAARQDYYDNINLLASLGQYDQLSQMGFDTSRLQALSDLEYQQALNSVNGTNNYRTSSSSSRSTGGSSSSGYSALNYEPEFSIAQVNSMISDGNVTPAVLDAYEYYNGVPYKAATPEQIRNAYSDPVNGTFVRGVGYISDEGIYQLNKMNKIAEVTDGNGAVYYTYKE